jgi:hypothetical protein
VFRELRHDTATDVVVIATGVHHKLTSDTVRLGEEPEHDVLGGDPGMRELTRFNAGLADARNRFGRQGRRIVPRRTPRYDIEDALFKGCTREVHVSEHLRGHTRGFLEDREEKVLRAHGRVAEVSGFASGSLHDVPRPRREPVELRRGDREPAIGRGTSWARPARTTRFLEKQPERFVHTRCVKQIREPSGPSGDADSLERAAVRDRCCVCEAAREPTLMSLVARLRGHGDSRRSGAARVGLVPTPSPRTTEASMP